MGRHPGRFVEPGRKTGEPWIRAGGLVLVDRRRRARRPPAREAPSGGMDGICHDCGAEAWVRWDALARAKLCGSCQARRIRGER